VSGRLYTRVYPQTVGPYPRAWPPNVAGSVTNVQKDGFRRCQKVRKEQEEREGAGGRREDTLVIGLSVTLPSYYPGIHHLATLGGPQHAGRSVLVNGAAAQGGVCRPTRLKKGEYHG